jgi:hypothetical protein
MSTTVTNRVAASALRGESVKVTLDSTDSAKLATMVLGTVCTASGSSNTGTISAIDVYGNSFEVTPIQPNKRFDGTAVGQLAASVTVTY